MWSANATSPTPPRIDAVFAEVEQSWGELDFVVHCIAFSDKDELTGRYVDTTRGELQNLAADLLLFLHRRSPSAPKS